MTAEEFDHGFLRGVKIAREEDFPPPSRAPHGPSRLELESDARKWRDRTVALAYLLSVVLVVAGFVISKIWWLCGR